MRTVEVELFKFEELSEDAKERARERYRRHLDDDFSFEADCITDSFMETVEEHGYYHRAIQCSLSCSQGDGVNFPGDVDLDVVLPRVLTEKELSRYKLIVKAGMYFREFKVRDNRRYTYYAGIDYEIDDNCEKGHWGYDKNCVYHDCKRVYAFMEKVAEKVIRDAEKLAHKLERKGYDSIDYYYSDEYVDDSLIGNDYDFTEDGERF